MKCHVGFGVCEARCSAMKVWSRDEHGAVPREYVRAEV